MPHSELVAGPIVQWGPEKVGRMADPSGLGREVPVFFEQEIIWVRESTTSARYMHGGKCLKDHSGHNDFYGFLRSLGSAIETAQEVCARYSITRESSLEYQIDIAIFDRPFLRDTSSQAIADNSRGPGWKKRFLDLNESAKWFCDDEESRELENGKSIYDIWDRISWIKPRAVVEEANIWSSRLSQEENKARVESFIKLHLETAKSLENAKPWK